MRLRFKRIIVTRMIHIMRGRGQEEAEEIKGCRLTHILHTSTKHIVVDCLKDVCRMYRVVIVDCRIVISIGGLEFQRETLENLSIDS
jgi:hypothetical protein